MVNMSSTGKMNVYVNTIRQISNTGDLRKTFEHRMDSYALRVVSPQTIGLRGRFQLALPQLERTHVPFDAIQTLCTLMIFK